MFLPTLIGAVGLFSKLVEAAPKGFNKGEGLVPANARGINLGSRAVAPGNNNPYPMHPADQQSSNQSSSSTSSHINEIHTIWNGNYMPPGCPTASILVTITTVDVTVFFTATSNFTYTQEPCDDESMTVPHTEEHAFYSTISTDCDEASLTGPKTTGIETEPCTDEPLYPTNVRVTHSLSTHVNIQSTETESCQDESSIYTQPTGSMSQSTTLKTEASSSSTNFEEESFTSHPPARYTVPVGNFSATYSKAMSSTKSSRTETASLSTSLSTSTSQVPSYTPPVYNFTSPGTKDVESTTTSSGSKTFSTPYEQDMPTSASNLHRVPNFSYSDSTTALQSTGSSSSASVSSTTPSEEETMSTAAYSSFATPSDEETMTAPVYPSFTAPSEEETVSSLDYSSSVMSSEVETSTTKSFYSVTPSLYTTHTASNTPPSEAYVIDRSMTPVSSGTMKNIRTYVPPPVETICEHTVKNGAPKKDNAYCGVHGKPSGTYFIAEFIEERPGVPVTLEGCYQFCSSVLESTRGCQAFSYYKNNLGAPRCDLYGMPVSWSVYELDASQTSIWYDLSCGSPSADAWHSDQYATSRTPTGTNNGALDGAYAP